MWTGFETSKNAPDEEEDVGSTSVLWLSEAEGDVETVENGKAVAERVVLVIDSEAEEEGDNRITKDEDSETEWLGETDEEKLMEWVGEVVLDMDMDALKDTDSDGSGRMSMNRNGWKSVYAGAKNFEE